jgi:hypothetical protein
LERRQDADQKHRWNSRDRACDRAGEAVGENTELWSRAISLEGAIAVIAGQNEALKNKDSGVQPSDSFRDALVACIETRRPIPTARCARQSGDTSIARPPYRVCTKRRQDAIVGNCKSSASPSAANVNGAECRQAAFEHVLRRLGASKCPLWVILDWDQPGSGSCHVG